MGHLEIRSKNVIYILETLFHIFSGLAIGFHAHRSRVWVIGCLEALVCLEEKARRSKGFWFHRELMLEYVGSWVPLVFWGKNHVWEKSGEFGLLETGKLQHHISYGISGFKVSTIWRIFYWLLLVLMGSNAMAAQQLLTQCPCVLLWLICWFDMFYSFKWLIWLYNDWTGLNYIVRFGLGVRWVPLSYPILLCPKMKHTHTPISTSQSSHYLPQEQRPCLEYVSVLDTSKCKKSQVHELFPLFQSQCFPMKKATFCYDEILALVCSRRTWSWWSMTTIKSSHRNWVDAEDGA